MAFNYAAHERVRAVKGRASWQTCECGNQAAEWAYQYTAGDREMTVWQEDRRNGTAREMAYSPDPDDYAPMCKSCHVKLDKRLANQPVRTTESRRISA